MRGSGEGWSDVKLTLSHKDFKGQAVSGVVLKNWSNDVVAMAADGWKEYKDKIVGHQF